MASKVHLHDTARAVCRNSANSLPPLVRSLGSGGAQRHTCLAEGKKTKGDQQIMAPTSARSEGSSCLEVHQVQISYSVLSFFLLFSTAEVVFL